jgi:hypothetical protein
LKILEGEKRNKRKIRSVNDKKLIVRKAEETKMKRGRKCVLCIVTAHRRIHQLVDTHEVNPSS